MNYTNKVCSFTGYRLQKLYEALGDNSIDELKAALHAEIDQLTDNDFTVFQCGMALGADMLFGDVVIGFKRRYPRVKFNAIIPCRGQERTWSAEQQAKYHSMLEYADLVHFVSDTPYFDGCMQLRNRYLVDTCDLLLAVYDGKRGGTMQTVSYAKKTGRKYRIIDPGTLLQITLYG
ncbi:MAG: SLOG family protein [Oscillospiraceae bacterium]|nr:SLOG family protein [Oscillospiraceae bacterium]